MNAASLETTARRQRAERRLRWDARGGICLRRILVSTDFSDLSRQAFPLAIELAREFRAEVTLLHVVPMQLPVDLTHLGIVFLEKREAKNSVANLNALRRRDLPDDFPVKTAVAEGNPALEIVRFAKHWHADLIVLATHGYSGLKHILLGSTAEHVVRASPCAVLLVPAKSLGGRDSESARPTKLGLQVSVRK